VKRIRNFIDGVVEKNTILDTAYGLYLGNVESLCSRPRDLDQYIFPKDRKNRKYLLTLSNDEQMAAMDLGSVIPLSELEQLTHTRVCLQYCSQHLLDSQISEVNADRCNRIYKIGSADLHERLVNQRKMKLLSMTISDGGSRFKFTKWNPSADEISKYSVGAIFLSLGMRMCVNQTSNLSLRNPQGIDVFLTPAELSLFGSGDIVSRDVSSLGIKSRISYDVADFNSMRSHFEMKGMDYGVYEVQVQIGGLGNTFLKCKRTDKDEIKYNSWLRMQDSNGEKVDVYVPTERLEEFAGVKRSDSEFKATVEDYILDHVEDRNNFKICMSRTLRLNPTEQTQKEFLVLQSMQVVP